MKKIFEYSIFSRIFAVFKTKNIFRVIVCTAFFYAQNFAFAKNIGYQIPVVCCTTMSANVLGRTGGDSLSYFNKFHTQMTKNMKFTDTVNNSSSACTPHSATTVSFNAQCCELLLNSCHLDFDDIENINAVLPNILGCIAISHFSQEDRDIMYYNYQKISDLFRYLERFNP